MAKEDTFKENHGLINNYPNMEYKNNSKAEDLIHTLSAKAE